MTILPAPPPDWKRPSTPPLGVQVRVLLRMLGLAKVEWDHRPPVSERQFDTETNDTIPPANDPEFIEAITPDEHDRRTNGPGGEKRITTAGSDSNRRAKLRRRQREEQQAREVLSSLNHHLHIMELVYGERRPHQRPKATIRSRGFDKTKTRGFDGKVRERKRRRRT